MPDRWLIVLNPKAGAAAKAGETGDDLEARLLRAASRLGLDAHVVSPAPADLPAAVGGAAGSIDVVVAAGGDGTVTAVARAVHASGGVLGVLPLGTFNHLARELGVPTGVDVEVMLEALVRRGQIRDRAVGELREATGVTTVFVNFASAGLHPEMVRDRDARLKRAGGAKRWYGKWPAMLAAAGRTLVQFRVRRLEVAVRTTDGDQARGAVRTPALFVGVSRWVVAQHGLDAPDRGGLIVLLAHATSRLAALWLLLRAGLGLLRPGPAFTVLEASATEVRTRRPRLTLTLDGELHPATPPLHFSRPGRLLRVLSIPPDDPPP